MKKILFVLMSVILLSSSTPIHQFHISQCLMEWNDASSSYEVSQFLFIDDLTLALEQYGTTNMHIQKEEIDSLTSDFIRQYVSLHFEIKAKGKVCPIHYIGEEVSDDLRGLWCYFEVPLLGNEPQISLRNDLLMDVFADQKNVITVKGKNNKEAYFLFKKGDALAVW